MSNQIQPCQAIPSPFEDVGVLTKSKEVVKRPPMYKVVLLNDDFTPMDFVVHLLQRFFNKNVDEATHIMLTIHHSGAAVCGIYTYEVAEAKVVQVMDLARQRGHPLQCTMEKD